MDQLNETLFYAIVKDDFATAKKMLDAGANPNEYLKYRKANLQVHLIYS